VADLTILFLTLDQIMVNSVRAFILVASGRLFTTTLVSTFAWNLECILPELLCI